MKSVNLAKNSREKVKNLNYDFAEYSTSQKRILKGEKKFRHPSVKGSLTGTQSKSATAISAYKIAATNCHWKLILKF